MKSYTDLEQSKKLAEFLPLESADMIWVLANPDLPMIRAIAYEDSEKSKHYEILPAWSLAALLGVLPKNLHTVLAIGEQEKYAIGSTDTNKYDCIADNPVDACVAMIEKLHEQNIL